MRRLAVIALVAACSRPPTPMPPEAAALIVTPWCLPMVVELGGVDVDVRACISELWACEFARNQALQLGAFGIESVGECGAAP